MSVSTASRPDSPKYSRAGAGVLTLRRPATNAPTISTPATTQIVAMMLPEAVVVIVSELPDDDDEAAGMISVAARATGGDVATMGAGVGAGAGADVGLPGDTVGEGVGRGVGAKIGAIDGVDSQMSDSA